MLKKMTRLVAAGMVFGCLAGGSAVAQDNSQVSERIVVTAPYLHSLKTMSTNGKRMVYDISWLFKNVSYADLDLSKAADAAKLEARVNDAAKDLCGQLKAKYPESAYALVEPQNCVKTSTDEAMTVVKSLIAASS